MDTLGIDVSLENLDVKLIKADESQNKGQFENTSAGHKKLQKWLSKQKVEDLHVCLEATNVYWEEVAEYLYEQGYSVSVVNPARIKGFAQSQMRRNKTDPLDAEVIAQFCRALKPSVWQPPTPEQRELRALVRHQQALQKSLTQQSNRLGTCKEEWVKASLKRVIEAIETEIALVKEEIESFIATHAECKQNYDLLTSIKGIGPQCAVVFLAEMYDLASYEHARAAAADAGLSPSHHSSGKTVRRKPKLCKIGKASVRGVLYFPAIVAMQHNPIVRALKERLEARGKPWKVILGAAMRKLVHLAYGVLKNQIPFDPNYVN